LGQWCLLYERCSYWGKLDGELLQSPSENFDEVEKSHHYVNAIYERILPIIGEVMNSIHSKNHSTRYWRILIGPWLQCYLLVMFERYLHIKYALDKHPDLTTICLSESSFVVSRDTLDFPVTY